MNYYPLILIISAYCTNLVARDIQTRTVGLFPVPCSKTREKLGDTHRFEKIRCVTT